MRITVPFAKLIRRITPHYYVLVLILFVLVFSSCKLLSKKGEKNKSGFTKEQQYKNTSIFIDASKEKILGNYQEALNLYSLCIKNDPNNSAAYFDVATIYSNNGQYKDAVKYAKKAVDLDKDNNWYQLLYAKLLQLNKEFDEAIKVYEKLVKKYPDNIDYTYELALAYNDAGKLLQVAETYDKLEAMVGLNEELSVQKYKIYSELKKTDKAFNELQKLIDKYPNEAKYYGMKADYYMKLNKPDEAFEVYNTVLKIEPDNALIRLSLSNYYLLKGDSAQSIENLKMAFENQSLDIDTKVKILFNYYIATDKQTNLKKEAFDLAKILTSAHPEDPKSHSIYADFLFRENKFSEAKDEYLKVLLLDSSKYVIWEQTLFCYSELRDYNAMQDISKRGLELFTVQPLLYLMNGMANYQLYKYNDATIALKQGIYYVVSNNLLKSQFYSILGDSYYKLNKMDSSDLAYDNALVADPNNIDVLNNYSYYLSLRNEYLDKAENMAQRVNILKPNNSSFLDTYAWVLYKKGKFEEAKIKIDEALKISGNTNAVILEHKGDIEYKLGNKEEALKYWEKAKSVGKGSEFLDKKISDHNLYE